MGSCLTESQVLWPVPNDVHGPCERWVKVTLGFMFCSLHFYSSYSLKRIYANAHQYLGTYTLHSCNARPTMETHAMKLLVLLLMPEEIWSSGVIESADGLLHTMSISTLWDLPISGWVAVVPTLLSFSIIPLNVHHISDWVAANWSWIFATMASYCSTTWEFKGLNVNCIARCLISYTCGNGTENTWIHSRAQYICPYSVSSFFLAL